MVEASARTTVKDTSARRDLVGGDPVERYRPAPTTVIPLPPPPPNVPDVLVVLSPSCSPPPSSSRVPPRVGAVADASGHPPRPPRGVRGCAAPALRHHGNHRGGGEASGGEERRREGEEAEAGTRRRVNDTARVTRSDRWRDTVVGLAGVFFLWDKEILGRGD